MFYRFKRSIRHLQPEIIKELFYKHNLDNIPNLCPKIGVNFFLLDDENIYRISEVKKLSIKVMKKRLKRGDLCFVTEYNHKLVSYHWLQIKGLHKVQQTNINHPMTGKDAVIYHVRVHRDFQGQSINSYVYSEMLKHSRKKGLKSVWIYTNKNNIANRKGLEKLGFSIYKKTVSLKFRNRFYLLNSKNIL